MWITILVVVFLEMGDSELNTSNISNVIDAVLPELTNGNLKISWGHLKVTWGGGPRRFQIYSGDRSGSCTKAHSSQEIYFGFKGDQ